MATSEDKLLCFDWLVTHKWTAQNLISTVPHLEDKHYCRVCDEWVLPVNLGSHATIHRREIRKLRDRRKKEALKKAQEARKQKQKEKVKE